MTHDVREYDRLTILSRCAFAVEDLPVFHFIKFNRVCRAPFFEFDVCVESPSVGTNMVQVVPLVLALASCLLCGSGVPADPPPPAIPPQYYTGASAILRLTPSSSWTSMHSSTPRQPFRLCYRCQNPRDQAVVNGHAPNFAQDLR